MIECVECGRSLPLEVLQSAAGFYIGHFCPTDGPHDRVSPCYWATREEAEAVLIAWTQ
jgi:hypothetical protein